MAKTTTGQTKYGLKKKHQKNELEKNSENRQDVK